MDKNLLIRLLTINSKVVLPGFGAFLHKPKDNRSIFTPFLKSDDGFLTSEVAKEYGVEESDAQEIVAEFIEHIKSTLASTGKYYFQGIGTLQRDINETIGFVMDLSKQIPGDAEAVLPETPVSQTSSTAPRQQPVEKPQQPSTQQFQQQPSQSNSPVNFQQQSRGVHPNPIAPQPITSPRVQFSNTTSQGASSASVEQQTTPPQPVSPIRQPLHQRPMQQTPRPVSPVGQTASRSVGQAPSPQPSYGGATPRPSVQSPAQPSANRASGAVRPSGDNRSARPANAKPQGRQLPRTPEPPRKKRRGDVWLVIAIIAAAIVVSIMIFGIFTTQQVDVMMP